MEALVKAYHEMPIINQDIFRKATNHKFNVKSGSVEKKLGIHQVNPVFYVKIRIKLSPNMVG